MASPPPPPSYTSVSRSKTAASRESMSALADEMLRASITRDTSSSRDPAVGASWTPLSASHSALSAASSESVSRRRVSADSAGSLADRMLRSSITRGDPSASASSTSTLLPPYSKRAPGGAVPGPSGLKSGRSASSPIVSSVTDSASSSVSWARLSAAESKEKLRKLHAEMDRASAAIVPRSTTGLYKEACSTDLLFLIDTTYSMQDYIDAAKAQVTSIIADIKAAFLGESEIRIAVVSYKDHGDTNNLQFLDFTTSVDQVRTFLSRLSASGGGDIPEDVLGGINQAINSSWKLQTRCMIHIADAPAHGSTLHDLGSSSDTYYTPGSEPHRLTYQPLLQKLLKLKINYALLQIDSCTDRMALAFAKEYSAAGGDVNLLSSNQYYGEVKNTSGTVDKTGTNIGALSTSPQFEEMELGITYAQLRKLVVTTVTSSVSRSAGRLSMALSSGGRKPTGLPSRGPKFSGLDAIREDSAVSVRPKARTAIRFEKGPPQWLTAGWLDEKLDVEGFCPDLAVHNSTTLSDMIDNDANIRLGVVELTVSKRSKPFDAGSVRLAYYARTESSRSRFVIKSFMEKGAGQAEVIEDMRIQALCKAFALEFNGLTKAETPIDFIVTTCLKRTDASRVGDECLSMEPYLDGEYIKYNNNTLYVRDSNDPFNETAQAFSHFTFERSWGQFLVADLQGVDNLFTDPAIHTRDPERFKLNVTNLGVEGFKFFFTAHKCNSVCRKLGLKSNGSTLLSDNPEYRERWPTMDPTVCCSNKLCRRILRLATAKKSEKFKGCVWCNDCWPQLETSTASWVCMAPGPNHTYQVSKFFYESQGQRAPRACPEHLEDDRTVSSAGVMGGSLYNRMKEADRKKEILGRLR